MTINLKNFLNNKNKMSKMGEFQTLKQIEGLEMSSISADLYGNGRDDLTLFYFSKGANYATVATTNTITSESILWNNSNFSKTIPNNTYLRSNFKWIILYISSSRNFNN